MSLDVGKSPTHHHPRAKPERKENQQTEPVLHQRRVGPIAFPAAGVLLPDGVGQIHVRLMGAVSKVLLVLLGAGIPVLHATGALFQGHDLQAAGSSPVGHGLGGPVRGPGGFA